MTIHSTTQFGFLADTTSITWKAGCIKPLPDHSKIVSGLLSSDLSYADWFYPLPQSVATSYKENKSPPKMPTPFGLPATHDLILNDQTADDKTAEFYIALLGLLKGLRLQKPNWNHFHKCPTKSGLLCDFYATDSAIVKTLDLAADFWQLNQDKQIRKLMFGAIHWHLLAQLYPQTFEKFNAQYTAMDACWQLAKVTLKIPKESIPHAERPLKLAQALGLQTPSWATPITTSHKQCKLSLQRNELVHEALYEAEPLRFAVSKEGHELQIELTNFVARCIFGLLGVNNHYTRCSSVGSRQVNGFDF